MVIFRSAVHLPRPGRNSISDLCIFVNFTGIRRPTDQDCFVQRTKAIKFAKIYRYIRRELRRRETSHWATYGTCLSHNPVLASCGEWQLRFTVNVIWRDSQSREPDEDWETHLGSVDFIINQMLGADRIHVAPVKVKLLQFVLAVQRSTFHVCQSTHLH